MGLRQAVTRVGAWLLAAVLLFAAVFWGVNAYLFTSGENANTIAVAASAAFASFFLVGAIFIVVAQGFYQLAGYMENMQVAADEQTRLLKYIAKQLQTQNKEADALTPLEDAVHFKPKIN